MKTQNKKQPNLGWLYYRQYFKGIDFDNLKSKNNKEIITANNVGIMNETGYIEISTKVATAPHKIVAKIAYPGLVTGIGLVHEIGVEGEFKLGIHLDYASGMPIIHGSSVKGLLRSMFPSQDKDSKWKQAKEEIIRRWLKEIGVDENTNILDLEKEIFDGVVSGALKSIYDRDIFFDAIPVSSDSKGRIVSSDSITPHVKKGTSYEDSMLKNPIPIPFLKIASGVTMEFRFDLKDGIIKADKKLDLFKEILKDFGIGAKTNVGYGQFSEVK